MKQRNMNKNVFRKILKEREFLFETLSFDDRKGHLTSKLNEIGLTVVIGSE
jgi:hypothetical protein